MKKLLTVFGIILFSISAFSQKLDNEMYFRFGYSNPSWKQFSLSEAEWADLGIDKKQGASFEFGTIFMINQLPTAENMAIGINVDYLYVNYNNFTTNSSMEPMNLGTLRVGSKIGPSFTYSPMDKLAFDVYAKADIAWASAAVIYENSFDDADDYFYGKIAAGFSTGLNVRYGILMLGFEFNTISPELESDDYPGEFLGNFEDADSDKSPLPCMNFTLGLSF